MRLVLLGGLLATLTAAPAAAQTAMPPSSPGSTATFTPNIKPRLSVSRTAGPIKIDGKLDDAGWAGAARAGNFAENYPREKAEPSVRSEVWVAYDDQHLYVGFIAYDDPGTIRASLRDRDQMWSDDYFGILLDTYGDASWAYFLFANPLGVQGDSRFATSGGEDDGFDIIYHTAGLVTDSGYHIEMAIPFASLRFPDRDVQTWRATFWRTRPRGSREQHTWAAIDRNEPCFLCQYGELTGIQGVKPGGALEIMPSVVGSQAGALNDASDPDGGFTNEKVQGDVAFDVRYAFAGGFTAEGTVNPDFSQVESDVAQIDVNTTFALFFPERRPFFQEGREVFGSFFQTLYTRQINNPQFATKLIGRKGRTTVAYLAARDEDSPILLPFEERSYVGSTGKSISNVVRFRQTFLKDSYVGATVTDRRLEDGGSGSLAGVDGTVRFLDNYQFEYQFLGSWTREPNDTSLTRGVNALTFDDGKHTAAYDGEAFTGFAQYTSIERDARFWSFDFDYWTATPTFRAENGFETRNNYRRFTMWQELQFYPNTKLLDDFTIAVFARQDLNYDGESKRRLFEPTIWGNLTAQTFVNFWYGFGSEQFAGVDFDDIRRWGLFARTNFSDPVRFGFFVSHGESVRRDRTNPQLGIGTDWEIFATLKPLTRLVIEPSINHSDLKSATDGTEFFSGYIVRTRTSFQFTRELFLRLVLQYNEFGQELSVEPLLTYKVNPFTLFFIGSSLAYQDYDDRAFTQRSRQIFAKFQYLFRY